MGDLDGLMTDACPSNERAGLSLRSFVQVGCVSQLYLSAKADASSRTSAVKALSAPCKASKLDACFAVMRSGLVAAPTFCSALNEVFL